MTQQKSRREDVIRSLLESMKQAVGKKKEPNGTRQTKKQRDLPLLNLKYRRAAEWVTHAFREHNKEAELWAVKGAKGRVEEWVDTAQVAWSEVIGLCGFWDGSCDNCNSGGCVVIMAYSGSHDWFTFFKKCGLVPVDTSFVLF